jgi:hypothetical protein
MRGGIIPILNKSHPAGTERNKFIYVVALSGYMNVVRGNRCAVPFGAIAPIEHVVRAVRQDSRVQVSLSEVIQSFPGYGDAFVNPKDVVAGTPPVFTDLTIRLPNVRRVSYPIQDSVADSACLLNHTKRESVDRRDLMPEILQSTLPLQACPALPTGPYVENSHGLKVFVVEKYRVAVGPSEDNPTT